MGSSGDGNPMGPMGGPNSMGNVLNGNDLDGMKNSPANGGPGTPREDSGSGIGDYNLSSFGGPGENVSFIWTLAKTKKKSSKSRKTTKQTNYFLFSTQHTLLLFYAPKLHLKKKIILQLQNTPKLIINSNFSMSTDMHTLF